MAEEIYGFDESKSKVTLKSGAGITVGEDGTIGHTNEMEASTTYIGGTTAVPMIKIDENGHVVALTKQTIYPPTSAGTAGQVWTSDGAGAGKWADPAGGEKSLISDISEVISISGTTLTVLKDFDIQYICIQSSSINVSGWISVSTGTYTRASSGGITLAYTIFGYNSLTGNIFSNSAYGNTPSVKAGNDGTATPSITTESNFSSVDGVEAYYYRIRA